MVHEWGGCVSPVSGASTGLSPWGPTFPSWLWACVRLQHSKAARDLANGKSPSSVSSHSSILKGQTSQGCQGMSGAGNRLWQSWEVPETGKLDLALPSAMGGGGWGGVRNWTERERRSFMGIRDAGSMRKQDHTCSFSYFVLFLPWESYYEPTFQNGSLHHTWARKIDLRIDCFKWFNSSKFPWTIFTLFREIRDLCHQTKPKAPAEEEELWTLEPGSWSFIWIPVHFEWLTSISLACNPVQP